MYNNNTPCDFRSHLQPHHYAALSAKIHGSNNFVTPSTIKSFAVKPTTLHNYRANFHLHQLHAEYAPYVDLYICIRLNIPLKHTRICTHREV